MLQPVGYFGGAFSPVHCGHVRIVFELLEGGHVSRVILVPASDAYKKPGLLPAAERLGRLRSTFAPMQGQVVDISTLDTDKSYFPHPMETAHELVTQRLDPSREELVWIIGGDRLDWIARNDDLQRMVAEYRFIVFERPPYFRDQLLAHPVIRKVADRLIFLPHWQKVPPIPFPTEEKVATVERRPMKKVLLVTDAKATFESVQLLQDMIRDALAGSVDLTVRDAGSTSVEDYKGLLQSHEAIVGTDAHLFQARRQAHSSVPLIHPSYGLGTRGLLQIWEWREGLQQGDAFICPSTADLAAAAVHIKSDQIRLLHVPYPIPDVYFQSGHERLEASSVLSRFGIDGRSQSSWLLYSGRLNQQKNIHMALRVIQALAQMNFSVGFLVVGKEDTSGFPELGWDNTGYENGLRRLAQELQIQDRVHFLGTVDRQTMYDLYHCVDIHLTCSTFRTEDFGFVPVEAMACGVPTVSTAWGGFWDTVQHGITGYRVPVYLTPAGFRVDWRAAVLRIARILSDEKLRSHLRRCCQVYAPAHFTPRLFRERMLEAIERLTQQRGEGFRPLDLAALVDEDTRLFFKDLEDRTAELGSVFAARKGLYAGNNSARVEAFFAEYARSQPVTWSNNTVVYAPLPLKVEGNEATTIDRNWSSTTTLSDDELRLLTQMDQAGSTLSHLAASMSTELSKVMEVCEAMMKKGIIVPLDPSAR
jgi:glycosyltransferase involved in cell wall biosynthesis